MYSSFCGNRDGYSEFVKNNLQRIIRYLKRKTNSHKVQVSADNKKIKLEYLLRASRLQTTVNELCSTVYQGDSFDDEKYNEMISCVQSAII